ncbi:MAG TPA: DUF5123 domain-containing protein [Niastella sp.]
MNKTLYILALTAFVYASCKKDDLGPTRLFRPVGTGELTADSNTIVASWQKIAGATNYVIEVSRDTFATIDQSLSVDSNAAVVKKLLFNQLYQVQVKAVAADTAMNSKWSNLGAVKTLSSILKMPDIDDITFNSVRARWATKGAPVTSLKIIKNADSSVVATVTLSATDVTNEFKVIDGLIADTRYTIYLYSEKDERGYVAFSTKVPFSGTVIDLTDITGRPGVLADTLPVIPSGSTILLKRGETYNISTTTSLNKTLIFMSGPDLSTTAQARIYFTSNFTFAANSTIDSIEFNDLYLYSDNYGGRYVFNNTNSANIGKLKFMNSRIEIFRGVVRLQSGTLNMTDFIVDNCIVDSISNYFVLTVGTTASRVNTVSMTNSTFYKVEGVIASVQTSNSVLISDCTFNEAPLGNSKNVYVDYNANVITNGLTIKNSLFGIGKISAGATTVKDLRLGTGTVVTLGNNYKTDDHKTATGNDFPTINPSIRTSVQLWQDPYNGNFKIADQTFPGRTSTGAPRWR